jgi:hypothetical protein
MTHCGKWEYTFYPASTTRAPGDIKDALNDHGREGWELCITAQLKEGRTSFLNDRLRKVDLGTATPGSSPNYARNPGPRLLLA